LGFVHPKAEVDSKAKILRSATEKDLLLIKSSCENYLDKLERMGKLE
jgi:hypothetical protein